MQAPGQNSSGSHLVRRQSNLGLLAFTEENNNKEYIPLNLCVLWETDSSIFSTVLRLFHNPKHWHIFQAEFLDVIGTKELSSYAFHSQLY